MLALGVMASGRREGGPGCVAGGIITVSGGISDASGFVNTAFTQRLSMRTLRFGDIRKNLFQKVVLCFESWIRLSRVR